MSDTCDDCGRYFFEYGDRVRLVQNHLVCGQVIDERGWEQQYEVRIVGLLEPVWYKSCELEPDPDFPPIRGEVEPAADADDGNVVDFATFKQGRA